MAGKAASGWHENYLAAAITAGTGGATSTVTLDRDPVHAATAGYFAVEPYTTNCEIRKPTSISGAVATLAFAKSLVATDYVFTASKRIAQGKAVTSSGDTFTTVSGNHGLAIDKVVTFEGPTPISGITFGVEYFVITAGLTLTQFKVATTRGGSAISVGSGTVYVCSAKVVATFYPGAKIVVSGSVSNNGIFTVTEFPRDDTYEGMYVTVVESLTNEFASGSVTIKTNFNLDHPVGSRVIWIPDGSVIPLAMYGVKGDGLDATGAANRAALQRALDDGFLVGPKHFMLPNGQTRVNDEVFPEEGQHLFGQDTTTCGLRPTATGFNSGNGFTGGHVATVHGRDNGVPVKFGSSGVSPRNWLYNFQVQGGNIAGANGILLSTEQPILIDSIRVQNCPGYGMCVTESQEFSARNLVLSLNGINLWLRSVIFGWFGDTDLEGSNGTGGNPQTTKMVMTDKLSGTAECQTITFHNLHLEDHQTPGKAVTVTTGTPGTVNLTAHGLANGTRVIFGGTAAPAPLALNTVYYVVGAAANTFQLEASVGGGALAMTTAGTGPTIAVALIGFDIQSGFNMRWSGSGWETASPGTTTFKFAADAGAKSGGGGGAAGPYADGTTYQIDSWAWGGNPTLCTGIEDLARGLSLNADSYFGRNILGYKAGVTFVATATNPVAPDGYPALNMPGVSGAYLSLGAPRSSNTVKAPFIRGKNASTFPGRPMAWRDTADREVFQILSTGAFGGGANATPVTGDLVAGQFLMWLDTATSGLPVLKVAAKDSITAGSTFFGAPTVPGFEIRRVLTKSETWDPGGATPVDVGALITLDTTVTGAAQGDIVRCSLSSLTQAGLLLFGTVSAPNTVRVTLFNITGANPTDVTSGTLRTEVTKYA